jgi:hypothetical protein
MVHVVTSDEGRFSSGGQWRAVNPCVGAGCILVQRALLSKQRVPRASAWRVGALGVARTCWLLATPSTHTCHVEGKRDMLGMFGQGVLAVVQ